MRIQHNITALNAHRNLTNNNSAVSKNLEKLSSGYRINRAGDDAAGLAISEKMRAQITGLQTAQKNAEDGVSLVQTAEGALTEVHSMLNRMVELATQSANGTYSESNRKEMQKEIDALTEEIDRISQTANFNGTKLFMGGDSTETEAEAVQVTAPTSATVAASGNDGTNAAQFDFDFAGVAFDKDGDVKVTVGGKDYTVAVTKDMTAEAFATAFADAFNADKITDAGAGDFTATATGSAIELKAANASATMTDTALATALAADIVVEGIAAAEPAAQADAPAYAAGDVFTYDFSGVTAQAADGETVIIGGETFTFKTAPAGANDITIGADVKADMNSLVTAINANTNLKDKFTAAYDAGTGALTLTAKADAATGDTAPADLTGTWAAGNVAVAPPEANDDTATAAGEVVIALHVGESSADTNTIDVKIKAMSSATLGIDTLDITTVQGAKAAIDIVNSAIDQISSIRSDLGALQNRLEHTINNLGVQTENITAAESRIRDVDMAKEMMAYTKNNILVQASQAMLAQANQVPQGVLQLLQ